MEKEIKEMGTEFKDLDTTSDIDVRSVSGGG